MQDYRFVSNLLGFQGRLLARAPFAASVDALEQAADDAVGTASRGSDLDTIFRRGRGRRVSLPGHGSYYARPTDQRAGIRIESV